MDLANQREEETAEMKTNKLNIYVRPNLGFGEYLRKTIGFTFMLFGPIALGAYLESSAMQWAAFVLGFLALIGIAKGEYENTSFATYDDAIAYLQEQKGKAQ